MQNTTLAQLADEYMESAGHLDSIIEKYTQKLHNEYSRRNYLKVYEIKRKLAVLYDQKRDVMTTAYQLKNYYPKEETNNESVKIIC